VSFLLVTFLWTSKEKSPAVGRHPQVAFEIARKARDTIQTLDSRLRVDDSIYIYRFQFTPTDSRVTMHV
jgi:hypothetical protein